MLGIVGQYVAAICAAEHRRGDGGCDEAKPDQRPTRSDTARTRRATAEREDRTVASYVRHLIAEAVRNAGCAQRAARNERRETRLRAEKSNRRSALSPSPQTVLPPHGPYMREARQRQEALQRLAAGETQADIARSYNLDLDPTTIGRLQ
jgi:hypothetical protein